MAGPRYRSPFFRLYQSLIRLSGRNLGVSAIIPDSTLQKVLVVRSRLHGSWGFPGGGVQHGESIYDAVVRECREELGVPVTVAHLSGIYYVTRVDSHTCVFRCSLADEDIRLSREHSQFRYIEIDSLPHEERIRATDALAREGYTRVRTLGGRTEGETALGD